MSEKTSNYDKTVKGMSSQTVVTVLLAILELTAFAIMSRLLTKTEFGYYAVIMSITMVFRSLAEAGIGASVIQRKNADHDFINTAYSLSIFLGVIATCIVMIFSGWLSDFVSDRTIHIPLILISLTILPYSLNSVYKGLFMKGLHFMRLGIFQAIAFTIAQAIAIMMAIMGYGLYAIVVGNILNILLQNAILRYFSNYKPHFYISKNKVRDIVSYGGWLTLSRLTGTIYAQIDKLLMSKWFSVVELGSFFRTRSFIDTVDSQLGGILDVTLFPILSNIQDDNKAIQNAYEKSMYMGCALYSLLFVSFFFNAKLIIFCVLGPQWLDQILLFRILSLSMLFYAFSRMADCFIRSLAFVRFGFFIKLLSCLLLIPGIFFMKDHGALGVAVAVVLVNLSMSLVKTVFICYKTRISFFLILFNAVRGALCTIPLVIMGVLFMSLFDDSIYNQIGFCIAFVLAAFLIFGLFPSLVGKTYKDQIYPTIKTFVLSRLKRTHH